MADIETVEIVAKCGTSELVTRYTTRELGISRPHATGCLRTDRSDRYQRAEIREGKDDSTETLNSSALRVDGRIQEIDG